MSGLLVFHQGTIHYGTKKNSCSMSLIIFLFITQYCFLLLEQKLVKAKLMIKKISGKTKKNCPKLLYPLNLTHHC